MKTRSNERTAGGQSSRIAGPPDRPSLAGIEERWLAAAARQSLRAPVERATVTGPSSAIAALQSVAHDIREAGRVNEISTLVDDSATGIIVQIIERGEDTQKIHRYLASGDE